MLYDHSWLPPPPPRSPLPFHSFVSCVTSWSISTPYSPVSPHCGVQSQQRAQWSIFKPSRGPDCSGPLDPTWLIPIGQTSYEVNTCWLFSGSLVLRPMRCPVASFCFHPHKCKGHSSPWLSEVGHINISLYSGVHQYTLSILLPG